MGQGGERGPGKEDKKVQPGISQEQTGKHSISINKRERVSREKEANGLTPVLRLFLESLLQ